MKWCLAFVMFAGSLLAQAELKFIEGKNLNFYYVFPKGYGELEQLKIGLKEKSSPVAFEVTALQPGFSLDLPFFQLHWTGEEKILEEVKELKVKSSHILLNKSRHEANIEEIELSHGLLEKVSMRKLSAFCQGLSVSQDLEIRLIEDCLRDSEMTIEEFYLPVGRVIIGEIIQQLPDQTDEDIQAIPYDVEWKSKDGAFFLGAKIKLLVKSRVKIKGQWNVDHDKRVLSVRLDDVKFGIVPITDLAFKELKDRLNDPKFEVKKPYIYYRW